MTSLRDPQGIWRGPLPDIDIPDVSLYDLLFDGLSDEDGALPAVVDHATGAILTFEGVKAQTDAFATWLAARGIGPGDAVGLLLPNCPAYLSAFQGILRSGAAAVPINATYPAPEVARQLGATGARLLVVHPALLESGLGAAQELGFEASQVIVLGDDPDHIRWIDVLATPPNPPQIDIDPATHVACLPFSSGTSGLPKPVMISHRNMVADMLQFDEVLKPLEGSRSFVAFLPYSHIYALTTNLNFGLYTRAVQYTMAQFEPMAFLTIIATYHPAILFVVPPVASFLAKHPAVGQIDTSSVKLIVSGAAPLDGTLGDTLESRLGARLVQGYGMTELSPVTHVIHLDATHNDPGSIGNAIPNVRFRVVDPQTGTDVDAPAPGEQSAPGELWCTGPNAMLGYLGNPASDATLDAAGWVHTGDLVTVDEEGVVTIVGRIKELIKRRGMQIAPAELEALLCSHPAVVDAAVVGVPSRTAGDEIPYALVQLRVDADATAPEIRAWLAERVAPHKRLGGVHLVGAVPRTASGKIMRGALRALLPAREVAEN